MIALINGTVKYEEYGKDYAIRTSLTKKGIHLVCNSSDMVINADEDDVGIVKCFHTLCVIDMRDVYVLKLDLSSFRFIRKIGGN